MRAAPIIVVAIATGLLLTGCTGVVEQEPTVEYDMPVDSSPVPTVTEATTTPLVAAGTIVATGSLVARLGTTTGEVAIVANGDGTYQIDVTGYSSDVEERPQIRLSPEPLGGEVDCSDNLTGPPSFGTQVAVDGRFSQHWSEGMVDPTERGFQDPAHFDEFVVQSFDERLPSRGCFNSVLAHAPLTWTLPVFHEMPPVVDGGPREGANGTTTSDDTGLVGYLVAEGDDSRAVAERFGLAMEDFVYCNPNLGGATDHPNLRPGSTQALRAPARS